MINISFDLSLLLKSTIAFLSVGAFSFFAIKKLTFSINKNTINTETNSSDTYSTSGQNSPIITGDNNRVGNTYNITHPKKSNIVLEAPKNTSTITLYADSKESLPIIRTHQADDMEDLNPKFILKNLGDASAKNIKIEWNVTIPDGFSEGPIQNTYLNQNGIHVGVRRFLNGYSLYGIKRPNAHSTQAGDYPFTFSYISEISSLLPAESNEPAVIAIMPSHIVNAYLLNIMLNIRENTYALLIKEYNFIEVNLSYVGNNSEKISRKYFVDSQITLYPSGISDPKGKTLISGSIRFKIRDSE